MRESRGGLFEVSFLSCVSSRVLKTYDSLAFFFFAISENLEDVKMQKVKLKIKAYRSVFVKNEKE